MPRVDDLSYLHPAIWYSEILSDTLLASVYIALGVGGLQILAGAVTFAFGATLALRTRSLGWLAPACVATALVACCPWLFLRPTLFALLLTSLVAWALKAHARAPQRRWVVFACVPLQAAWANTHQSGMIGIALIATYSVHVVLGRFAHTWARWLAPPSQPQQLRDVLVATGLAVLATALNPAGALYLFNPIGIAARGDAGLAHDGELARRQAPGSARAWFVAGCGAIAARDEVKLRIAIAALDRLAPSHASIDYLRNSWAALRRE